MHLFPLKYVQSNTFIFWGLGTVWPSSCLPCAHPQRASLSQQPLNHLSQMFFLVTCSISPPPWNCGASTSASAAATSGGAASVSAASAAATSGGAASVSAASATFEAAFCRSRISAFSSSVWTVIVHAATGTSEVTGVFSSATVSESDSSLFVFSPSSDIHTSDSSHVHTSESSHNLH